MKRSTAAALLAATGVAGQSLTTSTYIECTATGARSGTLPTITNTMTSTSQVCDLCEHMSSTAINGAQVHVTAWTTVYTNICSAQTLVPATYTITESCTGMTPTFTGPSCTSCVPEGFTTSMVHCAKCETPGPVPMTFPITQGPTVPGPAPTPAPEAPAVLPTPNEAPVPVPAATTPAMYNSAPAAAPSPAELPCDGCEAPTPANSTASIAPFNPNGASKASVGGAVAAVLALAAGFAML